MYHVPRRVTLDAHPVVSVLDAPIVDPDLRAEEPAVKLSDHVIQLLAGVCHLINHPELVVTTLTRCMYVLLFYSS